MIGAGPVLLALCRSGGALLAHAEGRRQGRQGQSDPGGPGASAARHRADRGLFAGGAGALGAHVRDLAEALAPGAAPGRDHHQSRRQPLPSRRSSVCPAGLRRRARPPFAGNLTDILSLQEEPRATTRCAIRTAASRSRPRHRHHYVARARISRGHLAVFHGPRCLARYTAEGELIEKPKRIRFEPGAGLWISGQLGQADLTTSPQAQQLQQKRSIDVVHKPVNSVCYRQ